MDKNKLFCEKKIFKWLGVCAPCKKFVKGLVVCAPWKKFGQKIKNFEIFFDIIDNHTCVYMRIKKNFKIFHFRAKFLNYLKGPPVEFFQNRFFLISMHSATKFHINLGCFLNFGLGPLPRELWSRLVTLPKRPPRGNVYES